MAGIKLAMLGVASGCVVLVGMWPDWSGALQAEGYYSTEPPNGDFESGDLPPWYGTGDVGVANVNVLEGFWSAFITTAQWDYLSGYPAVGDVCSHLISPPVYPPFGSGKMKVYFKVRYKTDEAVGASAFYVDPFHATLKTAQGSVDLLTIGTDGIFWSEDGEVETEVIVESTGEELDAPPQLPPFEATYGGLFAYETPALDVFTELPMEGCAPVQIRFQICDWWDSVVDSGAFIDEVAIDFKRKGRTRQCDQLAIPSEAQPPAPRHYGPIPVEAGVHVSGLYPGSKGEHEQDIGQVVQVFRALRGAVRDIVVAGRTGKRHLKSEGWVGEHGAK